VKKHITLTALLIGVTGLSALAMYSRRGSERPEVTTDVVSRGPIVRVVSATGALEAVTTVQVGSQVSGRVQTLYADYNAIVKKGQVLARLDPSLFQADVDRANADVVRAEAEVERLRIALTDADTKLERAQELAARQLIPTSEFDAARTARNSAEAQARAATAQVTQARASRSQAQVNLQKTVITSPIDGIVIARDVDVGQTVAASLQAPTLFVIAAGLAQLQVKASVDESDVGNIKPGQPVTFRVESYPNETFRGTVEQVRLNPVVEQNVVTYATIITAPNRELKLRPGMTATVSVEVARRNDVLRVPNAALRFKPADRAVAASNGHATVWMYDGDLHAVTVQPGVSDGVFTEIADGAVTEGSPIATRMTLPGGSAPNSQTTTGSGNPLMGPTPPRRPMLAGT
jgi:HlyD family secretion protein